jgi:hypothetical protein
MTIVVEDREVKKVSSVGRSNTVMSRMINHADQSGNLKDVVALEGRGKKFF